MTGDSLRIAVISPVWFPVPPTGYGGIEWIVSLLADGLADAGHDVTLFASGDSLTKAKLARMAITIQAARQFSYSVARMMAKGEGTLEAAMVKAYVCKAAEWVTREAMQIHGGMGYAEEFAVSRYFVDARVLSIFEGADETLCLRVIARRLAEQALT